MIIHQSDLSSLARCGEQHRRQLAGDQGQQLSATAYGTVMHHALHALERSGDLDLALETFAYYWDPRHIDTLTRPVEEWIARDSYGTLRERGLENIRKYWDLRQADDDHLLAIEFPFVVDIPGTEHQLAGTVDRLALRRYRGHLCVAIEDWKTGRKPAHLQWNIQFAAYAWASTQEKFWTGNPEFHTEGFGPEQGKDLFGRLTKNPRAAWWIGLKETVSWVPTGIRTDVDYRRVLTTFDRYIRVRESSAFFLATSGEVCGYCPFNQTCPEQV